MSKAVYYAQTTFWYGSEVNTNVFSIETSHLSTKQLIEYQEFLELVYRSPVQIGPKKSGEGQWLKIEHMTRNEAGLRVASWLYNVPFTSSQLASS